ncbi:hypothetical protein ColLi_09064 [Colletotrichum liriopes]|uniref:Uncharacterized protein n=1 Tax=Colletotrichum liriopes TaxID=708192 RepID=A0AA37GTQ6_9PEZI|nr:hypothetical protein ColLi_09064 [Colletotrichum liriopes]
MDTRPCLRLVAILVLGLAAIYATLWRNINLTRQRWCCRCQNATPRAHRAPLASGSVDAQDLQHALSPPCRDFRPPGRGAGPGLDAAVTPFYPPEAAEYPGAPAYTVLVGEVLRAAARVREPLWARARAGDEAADRVIAATWMAEDMPLDQDARMNYLERAIPASSPLSINIRHLTMFCLQTSIVTSEPVPCHSHDARSMSSPIPKPGEERWLASWRDSKGNFTKWRQGCLAKPVDP